MLIHCVQSSKHDSIWISLHLEKTKAHSDRVAANKAAHHLWLLSYWSECRPVIKAPVNLPTRGGLEGELPPEFTSPLQGWASFSSVCPVANFQTLTRISGLRRGQTAGKSLIGCLHTEWLIPFRQVESGYGAIAPEMWCDDTERELSGALKWQATLHTFLHSALRQIPLSLSFSSPSLLFFLFFSFPAIKTDLLLYFLWTCYWYFVFSGTLAKIETHQY